MLTEALWRQHELTAQDRDESLQTILLAELRIKRHSKLSPPPRLIAGTGLTNPQGPTPTNVGPAVAEHQTIAPEWLPRVFVSPDIPPERESHVRLERYTSYVTRPH